MTGIFLVLIAFVLIIIEAHTPSFGIFGIMAIVALLAGGNILVEQGEVFGIPMHWDMFIGAAAAMTVLLVILVKVAARAFTTSHTAGTEGMIGQDALIEDWNDKSGRVMIQGELWQAYSERSHNFQKNDKVTVSAADGLKLKIHVKE